MRPLPLFAAVLLLPVLVAAHAWLHGSREQPRLEERVREALTSAGVIQPTVAVRYLDVTVAGLAPDLAAAEHAVAALRSLSPLRLAAEKIEVPARLTARLLPAAAAGAPDRFSLEGCLPRPEQLAQARQMLSALRPDAEWVDGGVKFSPRVRLEEGEGTLAPSGATLAQATEAVRAPCALEVFPEAGRLVLRGVVPQAALKERLVSTLTGRRHGLQVDATLLRVVPHTRPAAFWGGEALASFLGSFYSTPLPGRFSLSETGVLLTAVSTPSLEAAWRTLLRPVAAGLPVTEDFTSYPSIFHFPGRPLESKIPETLLAPLRQDLEGLQLTFEKGTTRMEAAAESSLAAVIPRLKEAGPGLRLLVAGIPPAGAPDRLQATQAALDRADSVTAFLRAQGLSPESLQSVALDAAPAGSPASTAPVILLLR